MTWWHEVPLGLSETILAITTRLFQGLVIFVPALAYHFCLNLPSTFSQPVNGRIEIPCMIKMFRDLVPRARKKANVKSRTFHLNYVNINLITFSHKQCPAIQEQNSSTLSCLSDL